MSKPSNKSKSRYALVDLLNQITAKRLLAEDNNRRQKVYGYDVLSRTTDLTDVILEEERGNYQYSADLTRQRVITRLAYLLIDTFQCGQVWGITPEDLLRKALSEAQEDLDEPELSN